MNGDLTVRPAVTADVDAMAETAIAAWRVGFRGIVPDEIDPGLAWRPDRIAERLRGDVGDGRETLVAEVEGTIGGLVLFGPSRDEGASDGEGEVVALYVRPDHWRRGIGRHLVRAALDQLRATGFREAIVWTLVASPRNLAFYEALGFSRDGGTQRRPAFGNPLEVRLRRVLDDDG